MSLGPEDIDHSEKETTEVLYGNENILNRTLQAFSAIRESFDNCTDCTGPSLFVTIVWKEYSELKNRGIRLRFITEITKDNISYCKVLMKVTELRHLDGIKGNFGITDGTEYRASANVRVTSTTTNYH